VCEETERQTFPQWVSESGILHQRLKPAPRKELQCTFLHNLEKLGCPMECKAYPSMGGSCCCSTFVHSDVGIEGGHCLVLAMKKKTHGLRHYLVSAWDDEVDRVAEPDKD
jgi:hypothetical protein